MHRQGLSFHVVAAEHIACFPAAATGHWSSCSGWAQCFSAIAFVIWFFLFVLIIFTILVSFCDGRWMNACLVLDLFFSFVLEMRLLNLCSGTGSVSKPFAAAGWEVVEVDWDSTHRPTRHVDIMKWNCPYDAGHFDVIWASPDCTQYSIARTTAKTPRDFF